MTNSVTKYPLSSNIEIHSIAPDKYLVHQTKYGKRIVINKRIYEIIKYLDSNPHHNIEENIIKFGITHTELDQLYSTLAVYGIVESEKEVSKVHPADYLHIKATIIPENIVLAVSSVFRFLFNYWVFAISAGCFLIFDIDLIVNHLNFRHLLVGFNGLYVLKLQIIFVAGLFLHEFGHSSACKKFGANPGPIGFGFYLFTPVLYADVSDAWKLNRYQRLIIDLGGVYMQLLYCSILGIFYLIYSSPMLIVIIGLHLSSICVNLNPFFRFDGYWALSDITNIYNLRPKALEKANHLIRRFRKKSNVFALKSITDWFLLTYGFVCYTLLFMFLFYLIFRNPQSVLYFPVNIYYFILDIIHHRLAWISIKVETRRLLVPFAFYLMASKTIIRNWERIKRSLKKIGHAV